MIEPYNKKVFYFENSTSQKSDKTVKYLISKHSQSHISCRCMSKINQLNMTHKIPLKIPPQLDQASMF